MRCAPKSCPIQAPPLASGIPEPDDIFVGIENGVDTFDCVLRAWHAGTAALTPHGRYNITNARFADFRPSTRAATATPAPTTLWVLHLRHLFKVDERLAATLASIHGNERLSCAQDRRPKPS